MRKCTKMASLACNKLAILPKRSSSLAKARSFRRCAPQRLAVRATAAAPEPEVGQDTTLVGVVRESRGRHWPATLAAIVAFSGSTLLLVDRDGCFRADWRCVQPYGGDCQATHLSNT